MKINGTKTEQVKIDIDEKELARILSKAELPSLVVVKELRKTVMREMGMEKHDHIFAKEGVWCWEEECHGSHAFWLDREIRKALPEEVELMNAINSLESLIVSNKLVNG